MGFGACGSVLVMWCQKAAATTTSPHFAAVVLKSCNYNNMFSYVVVSSLVDESQLLHESVSQVIAMWPKSLLMEHADSVNEK